MFSKSQTSQMTKNPKFFAKRLKIRMKLTMIRFEGLPKNCSSKLCKKFGLDLVQVYERSQDTQNSSNSI